VSKRSGSYPRVRVGSGGRGVVTQAGSVLLVETARRIGLDRDLSAALSWWRKPRAVHDPGKVLLDLALAVALGGDCLADIAVLRAAPEVFGPVASDPTVSRLIDTLAGADESALAAIRRARSQVRTRVWQLVGQAAPDAGGQVTVDIDGVLVLAHSEKQDAAPTWKKTFGHHPLLAFVDHGPAGSGEPVAAAAAVQRRIEHCHRPHRHRQARAGPTPEGLPARAPHPHPHRHRRRHPRVPGLAERTRPVAVVLGGDDHHRRHPPGRAAGPALRVDARHRTGWRTARRRVGGRTRG
jgi:hypothetical protein